MKHREPYCVIRNLEDPSQPSPTMRCSVAIARAKLGDWGAHWQFEEAVLLDEPMLSMYRDTSMAPTEPDSVHPLRHG